MKSSSERNNFGRNLRDRTLVNHSESPELVNTFLPTSAYDFIDNLIKETDIALKDDSPIIPAFTAFLPSEATSLIDCNEQLQILRNHYGKDITDTYQSKSTFACKLIDPIAQKIESEELFSIFEDAYMCLLDRVKSDQKSFSQEKLTKNQCINILTKISHHLAMSIQTCAVLDVRSDSLKV